jgi:hypothetical protein
MGDDCVVCRSEPGPVGQLCRDDTDRQLRDLPGRYIRLAAVLAPGAAAVPGERVTTSKRVHAGLPARTAVLSLLGPGGDVPATLHPLVRHWSAHRKVLVTMHIVGIARTVEVDVTDWFHELVVDENGQPVMVPVDAEDQVGVVPPREWLDMQARTVRAFFGHHVPARTHPAPGRRYLPPAWRTLLPLAGGPHTIGFLTALHQAYGADQRMAYLGLLHNRHPDPSIDAIERRAEPPRSMQWDVDYLRTWLDKAFTEGALDFAGFTAQLRALHSEISRALGETPDQLWVGRCPAFIEETNPDGEPTGRKRPCGAGLWQDTGAYLSAQTVCPRCRSVWELRGHAGAGTAREIRRVWPVDRRRRYTADEIDRLRPPHCPGCGRRVILNWRDVTGTRDLERTWQPASARCEAGCADARRTL